MTPMTPVTRTDFHRAMRLVFIAFAIMFATNMLALVKAIDTSNATGRQTDQLQRQARADAFRSCRVGNNARRDLNGARAAIRHFLVVQQQITAAARAFQQVPPAEQPLVRRQDRAIRRLLAAEAPLPLQTCRSAVPAS